MEAGSHLTPTELRNRVLELKQRKTQEEETLKGAFQDLVQSVSPVQIVKNTLHKLSEDPQVKTDLKKVAITIGANILLRSLFSRKRNIQIYLAALVLEKVAVPMIRENWPLVQAMGRRITGLASDDANEADDEDEYEYDAYAAYDNETTIGSFPEPGEFRMIGQPSQLNQHGHPGHLDPQDQPGLHGDSRLEQTHQGPWAAQVP